MRQWKKFLNSLSGKVFAAIVFLVLPINIIAFLATETAIQKTEEQICLAKQDILNVRMMDLNKKMNSSTAFLSYFITNDVDAITMFQQKKPEEEYKLAKMRFFSNLRRGREMIDGADGYYFYMQELNDWLQYGSKIEKEEIQEYIQYNEREKTKHWDFYEHQSGNQYLIYSFLRGNVEYGCWFRIDKIKRQIEESIAYEHIEVVFQKEETLNDFKNYQVVAGIGNIFVKVILNQKEVRQELNQYPALARIAVICFIITIPILYWIIRHLILEPMEVVRNAHHEMQTGNQDYRITEIGNSLEVKHIYESFNTMANDLQKYKFDAYEKEIARQEMEILNLQLQIRPHFLLNMFNLLYMLLIEGDSDNLQEVILYLSNYFRYIFREGKETAIFAKEYEMIQQYIKAVAIRYRGRVIADYEIDPKVMVIRVPPLLIHNFVENAVKHGVKEKGVLHIFVEGKYEKGVVQFVILDDGNGMDDNKLEENRKILRGEYEAKKAKEHLGLYNTYQRLKYAYGDSASVSVESEYQKGTRYIIRFQYELDGEKKDETINSK